MKAITVVILCVGFLAVNFLLRKVLTRVKNKGGVFGIVNRYFPVAELIFWSVFTLWAVNILFAKSQFFLYIIFLMITMGFIMLFLLFIRDYIAGVQLKSRYNLSSGKKFKSGKINGIVKKTNLLHIEIKADNGSDFKIPYSQIDQKSIELNFQENSGGESLIKIDLDRKLNEKATAQKIAELVINSPWCSHKSSPNVNILENDEELTTYEISCILNSDNAGRNLKELIEKDFTERNKLSN